MSGVSSQDYGSACVKASCADNQPGDGGWDEDGRTSHVTIF